MKNEELTGYNKNKTPFTNKIGLKLREKLIKCCTLRIAVYGPETLALGSMEQKDLERFALWCCTDGWRISGDQSCNKMRYHIASGWKETSYIENEGDLLDWSHIA